MAILTSEQQNVLIEICNTGVRHSVEQLSVLLNTKIDIATPEIHLFDISLIHQAQLFCTNSILSYVYQDMTEDIVGRAVLIFQHQHAALLTHSVLGELPQLSDQEIRACEQEAMLEIGNIVISSCIHVVRHHLSCNIMLDFPKYGEDTIIRLIQMQLDTSDRSFSKIIVLDTKLETKDENIFGKLLLILAPNSITHLFDKLNCMSHE